MNQQTFVESRNEMEELLQAESIGYLGLSVDGIPYVVPLNYSYSEGRILFHCALVGKKLDIMRRNPRVCFTVGTQTGEVRDHAGGNLCHVDSVSVVCDGVARIIEDLGEREVALSAFNRRFRPDAPDVPMERVKNCSVVEIRVSQMTGRREQERKRTYWRFTFER